MLCLATNDTLFVAPVLPPPSSVGLRLNLGLDLAPEVELGLEVVEPLAPPADNGLTRAELVELLVVDDEDVVDEVITVVADLDVAAVVVAVVVVVVVAFDFPEFTFEANEAFRGAVAAFDDVVEELLTVEGVVDVVDEVLLAVEALAVVVVVVVATALAVVTLVTVADLVDKVAAGGILDVAELVEFPFEVVVDDLALFAAPFALLFAAFLTVAFEEEEEEVGLLLVEALLVVVVVVVAFDVARLVLVDEVLGFSRLSLASLAGSGSLFSFSSTRTTSLTDEAASWPKFSALFAGVAINFLCSMLLTNAAGKLAGDVLRTSQAKDVGL